MRAKHDSDRQVVLSRMNNVGFFSFRAKCTCLTKFSSPMPLKRKCTVKQLKQLSKVLPLFFVQYYFVVVSLL